MQVFLPCISGHTCNSVKPFKTSSSEIVLPGSVVFFCIKFALYHAMITETDLIVLSNELLTLPSLKKIIDHSNDALWTSPYFESWVFSTNFEENFKIIFLHFQTIPLPKQKMQVLLTFR